jgi:cell division protein FtsL
MEWAALLFAIAITLISSQIYLLHKRISKLEKEIQNPKWTKVAGL